MHTMPPASLQNFYRRFKLRSTRADQIGPAVFCCAEHESMAGKLLECRLQIGFGQIEAIIADADDILIAESKSFREGFGNFLPE